LDCYFAQIIGARDGLLMLINEKLNLKISEKDVKLESINSELKKKGKKQKIMKRLNKLSSDTTSWYWILNELRNKSIHRNIRPFHYILILYQVNFHISSELFQSDQSATLRN
jgi:hypothetical protein